MNDSIMMGLEGLNFNANPTLGKEIEIALRKLRKHKKVTEQQVLDSGLFKVISHHTGIKGKLDFKNGFQAAVLPPDIDKNNPVLDSFRKQIFKSEDSKKLLKRKDYIEGTVDLETGKVGGVFAEAPVTFYFGQKLFYAGSDFTVPEITAIILHEIGHIFHYYEVLSRLTSTNYILDEGIKALTNAQDTEQRIKILRDINSTGYAKIESPETIASRRREPDYYRTVIIDGCVRETTNQLGNNIYSNRGFEQLADQYATRMGYGKALVTGLDKLHRKYDPQRFLSTPSFYLVEAAKFITILLLGSAGGGGKGGAVLTGSITLLLQCLINPMDQWYDSVKDRYGKVRENLTMQLKEKDLTKEQRKAIVADINVINSLEDSVNDSPDLHQFLWQYVLPYGKKHHKAQKIQQELEALMNNRLTEAAARLQTTIE